MRDNKKLKLLVEQLERENRDLRKSVFDLNVRSVQHHTMHACSYNA